MLLHKMQAIRGYYRGLVPEASQFRPAGGRCAISGRPGHGGAAVAAADAVHRASMVAAINSILGGAGVALLAARLGQLSDGVAVVVGLAVALILFGSHVLYQQRRSPQVRCDQKAGWVGLTRTTVGCRLEFGCPSGRMVVSGPGEGIGRTRGRVQGLGRAEADLGPRTVTVTDNCGC